MPTNHNYVGRGLRAGLGRAAFSIISGGLGAVSPMDTLAALGRAARYSVIFSDGAVSIARHISGRVGIRVTRSALAARRRAAAAFN